MRQKEIWKPIIGYEGFYEISNFGRVKSLDRWYISKKGYNIHATERILKVFKDSKGYPSVILSKDGIMRILLVHRLIAKHFIPNPENKRFVDHINTDVNDYRIDNLRWCTSKENANNPLTKKHLSEEVGKASANEKRIASHIRRMSKVAPKEVFMYDKNDNFIRSFCSRSDAARFFNGSASAIIHALDRDNRTAYGYKWHSKRVMP